MPFMSPEGYIMTAAAATTINSFACSILVGGRQLRCGKGGGAVKAQLEVAMRKDKTPGSKAMTCGPKA